MTTVPPRFFLGGRHGSPPSYEHSTSEEEAGPVSPTTSPMPTPPIVSVVTDDNADLRVTLEATVDTADLVRRPSATSAKSSNRFTHPMSLRSFRRVRTWTRRRSGSHQKENASRSLAFIADDIESPPAEEEKTMKKSSSLVELKSFYRRLHRQFTTPGGNRILALVSHDH